MATASVPRVLSLWLRLLKGRCGIALLPVMLTGWVPSVALGEILAICGASKGHGYYLPGAIVSGSNAGWQEDAISKGSFQLIRSGPEYDIIFTDATGGTLSAKGDGGEIVGYENESGSIVVTIFYPLSVETYVFWFGAAGPLIATFSQAKHAAPIAKHALFQARCQRPRPVQ